VSLFPLPDFETRYEGTEWMDDPDVGGEPLRTALENLRWINRLLGGLRATRAVLSPLLRTQSQLDVLDVGTGTGDYLVHLARIGPQFDTEVRAVGVDLNPTTVGQGRAWLDETLGTRLRSRVRIEIGDALNLPYPDDAFDVVHAALFLHHVHGPEAVALLREMERVSRFGIVVNDLHRHPLAYAGIWILSRVAGCSPMVQHDGPLSVRRGFRQADLRRLADAVPLPRPAIRWHWAFRWTLSTV